MTISRDPESLHPPLASYAHQIETGPGGRWLVLSGQIGMPVNGAVPEDPIEQYVLALENVRTNLSAAAMRVSDLVKLTYYLVGPFDADARRKADAAFLNGHKPCMTLLYVSALAGPALRVEIDAWAYAEA